MSGSNISLDSLDSIQGRQLHLQCLLRHMIKAEVEGSGFLLLAAGCSAFKVGGATMGVDKVADLSEASSSIAPAPLPDFFFFVMLWRKY